MQEIIGSLQYPFVQRALLGGILVAVLTSWMGILVVLRQSSFFGDAIAHSSLMGIALGLLLGINPIAVAAIYAIFVSFLLPFLRKHSHLPQDSLLGFILPFSMGLGVILLALIPGYQPELISFLFGSILAIGWGDIAITAILALVTFLVMFILRGKLTFASFDSEYAKVTGIKVSMIDTIYHVLLAVTVVAGIRLVGIILVNALLVIPASTVRLFARSLKDMFIFTPILAIIIMIVGLLASFTFDIPSGPTIAVTSGLLFLITLVFTKFK
jgi:ABC-type Mn2+/Zn2+ transport system permease subunit